MRLPSTLRGSTQGFQPTGDSLGAWPPDIGVPILATERTELAMNPRQLKTFLAVAKQGNITRAASEANLAQSSLSDQMQALEEELGVPLFERSRQGVTLTPAGDVLKSYAEEILALND